MRPIIVLAFSVCLGCGNDKKGAATPPTVSTTAPSATTSSNTVDTTRQPVGGTLTVSGDIFRLCHLDARDAVDAAPKFAFDDSLITKEDAVVLDKIGACLATGALANRRAQLTGRADPRGTEEYNLSLGARRAHAVATYLEQHKVHSTALNETSRGALDSTGNDESTWVKDRRVDIALMP